MKHARLDYVRMHVEINLIIFQIAVLSTGILPVATVCLQPTAYERVRFAKILLT